MMIISMSVNGSGIRDISRVLEISKDTVTKIKKTKEKLTNVNMKYINLEKPLNIRIEMYEIEMYEMWGRVKSKKESSWLWHTIDHDNGNVIAYVMAVN